MADARGAVPRRVEVVLHVGVVGEKFTVAVEGGIEDVAESGGEDLEILAIGGDAINRAAGAHGVAHEAAAVGHSRKQMIFAPVLREKRGAELSEGGFVADDEEEGFAVGRGDDGVDAVIAAGLHLAEVLDVVERVIVFGAGDAI